MIPCGFFSLPYCYFIYVLSTPIFTFIPPLLMNSPIYPYLLSNQFYPDITLSQFYPDIPLSKYLLYLPLSLLPEGKITFQISCSLPLPSPFFLKPLFKQWSHFTFLVSIVHISHTSTSGDLGAGSSKKREHGTFVFLDLSYHTQNEVYISLVELLRCVLEFLLGFHFYLLSWSFFFILFCLFSSLIVE